MVCCRESYNSLNLNPFRPQHRFIRSLGILTQPFKRRRNSQSQRLALMRSREILHRLVVAIGAQKALKTVQVAFEVVSGLLAVVSFKFVGGDVSETVVSVWFLVVLGNGITEAAGRPERIEMYPIEPSNTCTPYTASFAPQSSL